MTATTSHRLDGLEPDNLLAFLTLLGLLRALELSRAEWQPRAYWDLDNAPLRPIITTRSSTSPQDISTAAFESLQALKKALRPFSWPRSKEGSARKTNVFSNENRKRILSKRCILATGSLRDNIEKRSIWQLRCDLMAISGSSRFDRQKKEIFDATPMKLPSSQMAFIGTQFNAISACSPDDIRKSLFQVWTYQHKGDSLRLSPEEAQRYAYRASDPSPEGAYTELGATALSGLGLLSLTMCDSRPQWRMVSYAGNRREGRIFWPIWTADEGIGASLQMIVAMLRALVPGERQHPSVRNLVRIVASARRFVLDPNQGDYGNITRAELSFITEDL